MRLAAGAAHFVRVSRPGSFSYTIHVVNYRRRDHCGVVLCTDERPETQSKPLRVSYVVLTVVVRYRKRV